MRSAYAKLAIAVVLDILDFTIGRVPGFEVIVDAGLGVFAMLLWGWPGLLAFWEIADPTGQIDAFVPTMTLLALSQIGRKSKSARDGAG